MPAKRKSGVRTPAKKRVPTSGGGLKAFGGDLKRSVKNLNTKMGKKAKALQAPREGVLTTWKKKTAAKKKARKK
jgi:hypothetical protein